MKENNLNEPESDLPDGLVAPAQRALAGVGYSRLAQFTEVSEAEILKLHGMGPKAMGTLRDALAARGLSFGRQPIQAIANHQPTTPTKRTSP